MSRNVLGVLSGSDFPDDSLLEWAKSADTVIAADSAGDRLVALGISPNIVIGDMDSSKIRWDALKTQVHQDSSQDSTDCDKLLSFASGNRLTLTGLEGDRLDHVLATISSVIRGTGEVRLLLRRGWGFVLKGGQDVRLPTIPGQRFSLIPLSESAVTLENAEWPLDQSHLSLQSLISVSNRAQGPIRVCIHAGAILSVIETKGPPIPDWSEPLWPQNQSP